MATWGWGKGTVLHGEAQVVGLWRFIGVEPRNRVLIESPGDPAAALLAVSPRGRRAGTGTGVHPPCSPQRCKQARGPGHIRGSTKWGLYVPRNVIWP